MSPVHFFSHGSTMMLGEESASARYWEKMGDEAIKNGVEHVVIMVSLAIEHRGMKRDEARSKENSSSDTPFPE